MTPANKECISNTSQKDSSAPLQSYERQRPEFSLNVCISSDIARAAYMLSTMQCYNNMFAAYRMFWNLTIVFVEKSNTYNMNS